MQQERQSGGGFQNRDSYRERLNSNRSIDRFARRSNSPSLNHRIPLIDAMEIQPPQRKSDLYENILGDQARRSSNYKRSSNLSRDNNQSGNQKDSPMDLQPGNQQLRIRSLNQRNIHQCTCDKECNQQHCVCFLYSNELCVIGLCCSTCIKIKNSYLNRDQSHTNNLGCFCKNIKCLKMYCSCYRQGKKCSKTICKCQGCQNDKQGLIDAKKKKSIVEREKKKQIFQRQNNHLQQKPNKMIIDTGGYSFTNCSCKKSHCLKKYCSCFVNNKSCNQTCTCQDCYNKFEQQENESKSERQARIARYGRHGHELEESHDDPQDSNNIDQYLNQEENYQNQQLNQNMQFEPVNFDNVGK